MRLFVWDFHGVLEKGTEGAVLEISNQTLEEFGYSQRFTKENIDQLYGLKWFEYFAYLLSREPSERHLALQQRCIEISIDHPEIIARNIKPNDHVYEVLEMIARRHYQILISNTQPRALDVFLDSIKIKPYFSDGNAFAIDTHQETNKKTKQDILEDFLRDRKFEDLVVISDSPQDMELISLTEGTSYLYSHPNKPFKECNADYKINNLRELLKEI